MKTSEDSTGGSPVKRWRAHCSHASQTFAPLSGTVPQQQRTQRFEAHAVSRLLCDFESLHVRAIALRSLAELRECSVRQVAQFFAVEDSITVAAISLLAEAPATVAQFAPTPGLVRAA